MRKNIHDKAKPSISVIIPYYNGEKYWAELVDSLRMQTSKLDEAAVILDGEDQFLPEINFYGIAHNVKIIKLNRNTGVANARNIGIDAVESDYIFFLDQDDYFYPTRVAEVRKCIEDNNPDWVVNNFKIVSKNRDVVRCVKHSKWLNLSSTQKRLENHFMLKKGGAKLNAICCKKSRIKKFDSTMGSCDDFVFIFNLLELGPPFLISMFGNARRYHDSNNSQSFLHRKSQIYSIASMCRKYNFKSKVRKRSLSNLCFDFAVEGIVYRGGSRSTLNFSRAFKINRFNLKALIGLIFCKISKDPVRIINQQMKILSFFKLIKSRRIIGS